MRFFANSSHSNVVFVVSIFCRRKVLYWNIGKLLDCWPHSGFVCSEKKKCIMSKELSMITFFKVLPTLPEVIFKYVLQTYLQRFSHHLIDIQVPSYNQKMSWIGHLHDDIIWLQLPECFEVSYCIQDFSFVKSHSCVTQIYITKIAVKFMHSHFW